MDKAHFRVLSRLMGSAENFIVESSTTPYGVMHKYLNGSHSVERVDFSIIYALWHKGIIQRDAEPIWYSSIYRPLTYRVTPLGKIVYLQEDNNRVIRARYAQANMIRRSRIMRSLKMRRAEHHGNGWLFIPFYVRKHKDLIGADVLIAAERSNNAISDPLRKRQFDLNKLRRKIRILKQIIRLTPVEYEEYAVQFRLIFAQGHDAVMDVFHHTQERLDKLC